MKCYYCGEPLDMDKEFGDIHISCQKRQIISRRRFNKMTNFVGELPEWADGDHRLGFLGDGNGNIDIIIIHPMYPPHILNKETQKFEPMDD